MRFLHHLQVDRSAYSWSVYQGLVMSFSISSIALVAVSIIRDPISLRIRAIRRHAIAWLPLSFLRPDADNDVILFELVILRIVNLILADNWVIIVLFVLGRISCIDDLISALSHAFRLFCNENAGRPLRVPLDARWVYQTKFLEERSLFFSRVLRW